MNRSIATFLALLSIIALTSVARAEVTNFKADTDDRSNIEGHGYSKSGDTETFIIAAADRKKGQRLTPRVEREFDGKGRIKTGKGVYTFSATYKIDAANDTTIFQLLNHDPKSNDTHKPLCFITVFSGDDGAKWHIHRGNSTDKPLLAAIPKKDSFTAKLQTDGTRWVVWIDGKQVADGGYPREGKNTSMRYGAYHHGKGVARVHVNNAMFQLNSNAKLSEPSPRTGSLRQN